jgi:hypothetical protein
VYYYSLNPSRTLTVSGSGGNLTAIDDTRLQAGAYSTAASSYPSEATTAEPSEVTVSYQRITQSAASVTTTADTGKTFPIYWDGSAIKHMTEADFLDTFIYPAIDLLASGSTTSSQAGTYFIATSHQWQEPHWFHPHQFLQIQLQIPQHILPLQLEIMHWTILPQ